MAQNSNFNIAIIGIVAIVAFVAILVNSNMFDREEPLGQATLAGDHICLVVDGKIRCWASKNTFEGKEVDYACGWEVSSYGRAFGEQNTGRDHICDKVGVCKAALKQAEDNIVCPKDSDPNGVVCPFPHIKEKKITRFICSFRDDCQAVVKYECHSMPQEVKDTSVVDVSGTQSDYSSGIN